MAGVGGGAGRMARGTCHIVSGDRGCERYNGSVRLAVLIWYMSVHYFPKPGITLDSIIKCHVITCYRAML